MAKLPMAEVLRTKTISEPRGFMKVLVAKDSDEILGFTAFGFEASELMVAMQTAMLGHLPYTVLRDAILTHPTMSEGLSSITGKRSSPMSSEEERANELSNQIVRQVRDPSQRNRLSRAPSVDGPDIPLLWHIRSGSSMRPRRSFRTSVTDRSISWMYPVFGVRGACWFLGVSEWTFGALLFIGFWNKTAGVLGALGGIASFVSTTTIIPFMPGGWAASAGGFPAMTEKVAFLMKDFVLLAVSFYLLKQDLLRLSLAQYRETTPSAARQPKCLLQRTRQKSRVKGRCY